MWRTIKPLGHFVYCYKMISENGFSDMGPKFRFLCYQKRPCFLIWHFLITFSDRPILLENQLFPTGCTYQKTLLEKGLNFRRMSSCSGHGRSGSISTPQAENIKYQSVRTRSRVSYSTRKTQSCPENISVAFAACVVQQLRPRYRLINNVVGGRLHSSTVCMTRVGLRAAFVWLCKPQTIETTCCTTPRL